MSNVNINLNPKRTKSQKQRVLEYLQQGGTLTSLEALYKFGTQKVSTRISELIHKDGHTEIQKRDVWVKTADGVKTRVKQYYIQSPIDFVYDL